MGRRARIIAQCSRCDHSIQLPVRPDSVLRCPKCQSMMQVHSSTFPLEKNVVNRMVIQKEVPEMSTQQAEPATERFVPAKVEFLKQVAAGKSISKLERLWNMNPGSLHYWVGKWSLKGIKSERAQQLLDEMVIDGEAPSSKPGLIALNEQIKQEESASESVSTNKDAEIEDLRNRLKRAIDRIETMTETTNDALDRNSALQEKIGRLETENANVVSLSDQATEKQTNALGELLDSLAESSLKYERVMKEKEELKQAIGAAQLVIQDLEHDRTVLLETVEKAAIVEDVAPAPKLAGRSFHTELDAPTEHIVDELAALISYIRSIHCERFYLDLQLNEVS